MSADLANRVLDLRTYRLRPGVGVEFHRTFRVGALPMLERHGIDVVAYGPSLLDEDRYVLLRSFASLQERQEQLDAFYGSREWLDTYDEQVMSMIETYHVVVLDGAGLGALPKG